MQTTQYNNSITSFPQLQCLNTPIKHYPIKNYQEHNTIWNSTYTTTNHNKRRQGGTLIFTRM